MTINQPPKKDETFVRTWNAYIDDIEARDNFKKGHLEQLRILCDLMVEEEQLKEIIQLEGYTYISSGGRNGDQEKIRPEVAQLNRVRAEIRSYMKMLGLILAKDKTVKDSDGDDWE